MSYIYSLYCTLPNVYDIYIGSTKNLRKRYMKHMYSCKNNKQYKLYKKMRETGSEHWKMSILEYSDILNTKKLRKLEQDYIDIMAPTLNSICASRSYKEYYEQNKEKILKNVKTYRKLNKEKIRENKSKIIECSCGRKFTKTHKARHEKTKYHKQFSK